MELHPYLVFDGRCEEAFAFYERQLGAKIVNVMHFGGTPMAAHMPPEFHAKVIHGQIRIGDQIVMASDAPPDRYQKTAGISLTLVPGSVEEAERVFAALAEGGQVTMPIQQTFWAARFGTLNDRFGIPWMINCDPSA